MIFRAIVVSVVLVLAVGAASAQKEKWVLPTADGGPQPSPPSVHGYLVKVAKQTIVVRREARDVATGSAVTVELNAKTDFFTAFGGLVKPEQLRPGQYVWVWYVTAGPMKAGTPPAAASVVLWSTDPSDKPSPKVRWSYDKGQ